MVQHKAVRQGRRIGAILSVFALTLSMGSVAFADEPTGDTQDAPAVAKLVAGSEDATEGTAKLAAEDPATAPAEEPAVEPPTTEAPKTEPPAVPAPTNYPEPTKAPEKPAAPTTPDEPKSEEKPAEPEAKPGSTDKTTDKAADEPAIEADALDIMPLAIGPDGGSAPYVYWNVKDTDGNLVPGATFAFRYRSYGEWTAGTNAGAIVDCAGTCSTGVSGNSLDRDPDGGEWLLEHRRTDRNQSNRLSTSNRYSVQQGTAPAGYEWVVSGPNTQSMGINNPWGGTTTYNFGTFQVRKIVPPTTNLTCAAGYVYGIGRSGQLQQITPNGVKTNIGTAASNVSSFNALGIGPGGDPVYALNRTNSTSTATIYKYNTTTGVWTNTGTTRNTETNLVAGAVDLSTGIYYFGGYMSNGNFRIYSYNPSTNSTSEKITVVTGLTSDDNSNGDMAFDSTGALFIVRGAGSITTVYSLTAAEFAAGGTITKSASNSVTTTSDVNGVAFDSNGKGYLGASSTIQSFDMPGWTNRLTHTSSLSDSTDLASCSSPPTITIEKEIVGGRVSVGDQFRLSLKQGATTISEVTTTGSATGVQSQRIGPLPTVRNVALSFSEVGANGADLTKYASAYQCTVTHASGFVESLAEVSGTSGTITIPTSGNSVRCVFRNSPLVAKVTIHKDVTDGLGENPTKRQGWTVGAQTTATTGTVSAAPAGTTQLTNADGDASWQLTFNAYASRATVKVSEVQQAGYEFLSGACKVTSLSGAERVVELASATAYDLTGIAPGDTVDCSYTNKPTPGDLKIVKALDSSVPSGFGAISFSGTYTCTFGGETVASGTWARNGAGEATLTRDDGLLYFPAGSSCSITETAPTGSNGLPNSSWEWGVPVVGSAVTIQSGTVSTITVTNKAKQNFGNFSVTKVVPEGSTADATNQYSGAWSCTIGTAPDVQTVTGNWGPIAAGATWTSTDADKIPLGASCAVTSETRPADPVSGNPSYQWDGDANLGMAVVAAKTPVPVITVTNKTKQVLGSVVWTKVNPGGDLLGDSTWTLTGPGQPAGGTTIADCTADPCAGPDMDPAKGKFKLVSLAWGDYTLVEATAPPGHLLDTTPHHFTVGASGVDIVLDPIKNVPVTPPTIPLTGGIGRDTIELMGLGVLTLGFGAALAVRVSKRRKEVASA